MLTHLSVRDFAIVEAVEIALGPGLTVVSGETGAGKSLLVDALLLLSGSRADSGAVRAGCERAELSAAFDLARLPQVRDWLASQDLDQDGECLLRRVVRAEGASRAWINGRQVTAQLLAELASRLVEIHGQHEHQALLDRGSQLSLLDRHGRHEAAVLAVAEAAAQWLALERRRAGLQARTGIDGAALDLLRHHLDELDAIALAPEALAALDQEHHRLAHHGEALQAAAAARALLDGEQDGSVLPALSQIRQLLATAVATDPRLEGCAELLASAELELREAGLALDGWLDQAESDPARLQQIDRQLARLHDLARKHRQPVAALVAHRDALRAELDAAMSAGRDLDGVERDLARARARWHDAAAELTRQRTATAARLGAEVGALMAELGMPGGRFDVALEATGEADPDRQGAERVEFLVSANPGQPPRPLRKVASGGELSRIALAIEVAALGEDLVPTMVFDEVDAGVGGAVAEILGQKLRRLGGHAQVLCVTHLAQVASQGHHHLQVRKQAERGATRTRVEALSDEVRVQEIARMLGGVRITPTTLEHARQMLAHGAGDAAAVRPGT
jgi:DNA repair protein RecN (Recombination protein N)